jgi:tRNA uridine 5-carbamoylmethylation protein Kti12|tara:strand:+ start:711 stop:1229 length:519 start_codon:yes stop_codon:yes gene_type:complete
MKNICYILRGLPGTGKSRLARLISAANNPEYCLDSFHVRTFSTDDLFINEEGVYEFDPSLLKQHHEENLRRAIEFFNLHPETANAPNWAQIAIIDNTNVRHWEYEPYVAAAKEAGWDVQIITLDWDENDIPLYAKRNKHGVPEEAIRRMADRWEYPADVMKFGSDKWRDTLA